LRTGDYRVLSAETTLYVFARTLEDTAIVVAVNIGLAPHKATIDLAEMGLKLHPQPFLFGVCDLQTDDNILTLEVPARSGCVLEAMLAYASFKV
jgi:cyclomaltodextrinase